MLVVRIKEMMCVKFLAQGRENIRCLRNVNFFSVPDIPNHEALAQASSSDPLIHVKYVTPH